MNQIPSASRFQSPVRAEALAILERLGAPEALLAKEGLPARSPITGEIITHGRDGVLVPDGDVPGLAAALRAMVRDPAERARAGREARASARRYALPAVGAAWEALLEDLVRPSKDARSGRYAQLPAGSAAQAGTDPPRRAGDRGAGA